jgi:hypothetical protein
MVQHREIGLASHQDGSHHDADGGNEVEADSLALGGYK